MHTQKNRTAAYRWCRSLGLPCAMVGRLMPCSPGSRMSFWPPSPRGLDDAVCPVGLARTSAIGLTVATTARTTRFCRTHGPPFRRSIPGPCTRNRKLTGETKPSSAVRHTRLRAHRDYPPCPHLSCRRCRVHRKPGSRSRRPRDRPSWLSRDGRHIRCFRISVKWNIFALMD